MRVRQPNPDRAACRVGPGDRRPGRRRRTRRVSKREPSTSFVRWTPVSLPTPMLIAMLSDPYPESRILAIRVVASSGDPSQTTLLPEYFRDQDFRVRYEVMVAAGRLGPDGRNLALAGLRDATPKVRQAAAWAACHGGVEALGPLMALMEQETDTRCSGHRHRQSVAFRRGRLGVPRGLGGDRRRCPASAGGGVLAVAE